jgi:Uma2 family endonuclease
MPTETPRIFVEMRYHEAAQEYLRKLPLEHFMEATPQATQREITVESFALIRARRPDFHYFNELLVQYPLPRRKKLGQVVPDNMVVVYNGPIKAEGSYDVPLQPAPPFLVLEYVSKRSKRKDYDDNMQKYEHELKVPYYLLFVPEEQELSLYRHSGEKYVSVIPNGNGRHSIAELELEVALLGGWVRYWFRGELLPLPAELQSRLEAAEATIVEQQRELEKRGRELEKRDREIEQLRAELERLRGSAPDTAG